MRRVLLVLLLLAGCARVENPTEPTPDREPATPTTPAPAIADRIDYRVVGTNLFSVTTIKTVDPVNGTTLTSSSLPYLATVTSTDPVAFLYVEATAIGASTATLQVQIFVNGRIFREDHASGAALFAVASGTFRH